MLNSFMFMLAGACVLIFVAIIHPESQMFYTQSFVYMTAFICTFTPLPRVATGENWPDVMLSCESGSLCDGISLRDTCGSNFTYVFFPFFYYIASILVSLILISEYQSLCSLVPRLPPHARNHCT